MTITRDLPNSLPLFWIILGTLIFGTTMANFALAQEDAIPERGERGIVVTPSEGQVQEEEGEQPESKPKLMILPPLSPEVGSEENLSPVASIKVTRIILVGNTVLSDGDVAAVIATYENRLISIGELHDLRLKLSKLYFNHGYVTSGVIIPDQKVEDGVIELKAIEGRLTKVEIIGNKRLRNRYLAKRIASNREAPLNTKEIQNSLRVLQFNPRIRQINAQLLPGINLGESILRVKVTENQNYWVQAAVDNYRPPTVDEKRASLSVGHNNLTGNGDTIEVNAGVTQGLNDYGLSYAYPLTARDVLLTAYYSKSDSSVVEQPFDLIDIKSETDTWGASLSEPFRSADGRLLVVSAGFEHKRGANTLLGIPFSFSPGERDGKSAVSVVHLSTEWLWQKPRQALKIFTGIRIGVDALNATINQQDPDSKFLSFQGQIQHARKLAWRSSQMVLRAATQLTQDPLLPLEKFSVGGNATVRGYRENTFVRDNGFIASAELRIPMFVDEDGVDLRNMSVVPFADYGVAWDDDNSSPTSDKSSIGSIGLGYRWAINKDWYFKADYGYSLKDMHRHSNTLQDKGLHLQLAYSLVTH